MPGSIHFPVEAVGFQLPAEMCWHDALGWFLKWSEQMCMYLHLSSYMQRGPMFELNSPHGFGCMGVATHLAWGIMLAGCIVCLAE